MTAVKMMMGQSVTVVMLMLGTVTDSGNHDMKDSQ